MGLNAKNVPGKQGNFTYVPLEPGTYPARLVQVIDLGLQAQRPFQGQEKAPAQEITFTYELADEFMKDEDGEELKDKPRWISETMAFHPLTADLAKSTKRYKVFDPTGAADGDLEKLLGVPVMVTVINNPSKKDPKVIYDNIASVAGMREKDAAKLPDLVNKPRIFNLDEPDMGIFLGLPKFVQEKIKANLNYKGSKLEALLGNAGTTETKKSGKAPPAQDDLDDENPY